MDPQEWYKQMPPVTKFLFTGALVTTLAGNFGLVSPYNLVFIPSSILSDFQIWRLITCGLFFGKLGFPFLINVYFLYNYSNQLEKGVYDRRTADYVYMLIINWTLLLVVAFFMNMMIIGIPLVISILYVWCNINAETVVRFWFGTTFKAMYLPWVLAGFNVLLGGTGMQELIGIVVGHVYFFLKYKYPEDSGRNWLETPSWLKSWIPDQIGGVSGFGQAPASRQQAQAPQHRAFQGRGQRLGDQ